MKNLFKLGLFTLAEEMDNVLMLRKLGHDCNKKQCEQFVLQ